MTTHAQAKSSSTSVNSISELGLSIVPRLVVNYKHDDNITNAKTNTQSANVTEIMPSLRIAGEKYNNQFDFTYQAKQGLYHGNTELNYTDHLLMTNLSRAVSNRHRFALAYAFNINHDAVNTGIAEGSEQVTSPSLFYTHATQLNYSYGGQTSTMVLTPRFGFNTKQYDDNDNNAVTMANFAEYNYGLSLYYKLATSLKLLLDISHISSDYDGDNKQKDSNNNLLYSGLNWDITGKTKGSLKIGYEKINFADNAKQSQVNPSWDIGISWYPKTYSVFTFNTKQKITNAITNTDSIVTNTNSLNWQHQWRHNLSSVLSYHNLKEKYQSSNRKDKNNAININFSYQFRDWLALGLSYEYRNKSSSQANLAYEKNIYGLTSQIIF